MTRQEQIKQLESEWANSPRWKGVTRNYSAEDVVKLRGTVQIEHTLARLGSALRGATALDLPACFLTSAPSDFNAASLATGPNRSSMALKRSGRR